MNVVFDFGEILKEFCRKLEFISIFVDRNERISWKNSKLE